jgi:Domain of unknown function (DUF4365)
MPTVEQRDPELDREYLVDGLPMTARFEHFSLAFTRMVVYVAGCCIKSHETDYDGVDITIVSETSYKRFYAPECVLQLKCTTQSRLLKGNAMTWPMKAKPYRKLTVPERFTPAYLGVLLIPDNAEASTEDWLSVDEEKLVSKSRMYWEKASAFEPLPSDDPRETVTVKLPRSNLFTGLQLLGIMRSIGDDEEEAR